MREDTIVTVNILYSERLKMAWINRFRGLIGGKQVECRVVVVGLPNSGKSTSMIQLKPPDVRMQQLVPAAPIDDAAEEFHSQAITFTAFDLGKEVVMS